MSSHGPIAVAKAVGRREARAPRRITTLVLVCVTTVLAGFLSAPAARAATAPVVTAPANQFSGVGRAISTLTLTASGGTVPLTWSATSLPPGLSINAQTGVVTGTPTTAGTYAVKVTATDAAALAGTASFSWTTGTAPTVAALAAPGYRVSTRNTAVSAITHTATGGTTPYVWSATGLPTGLTINSSTGAVTGTPTVNGSYAVKVTATAASKIPSAPLTYTWDVADALAFTAPATQQGTVGQATSLNLSATAGRSPYTWTVTGLPAGLTATTAGAISGTPTTSATSTVSATVKDAVGRTVTRTFSWVVAVGPAVNAPVTQNSTTGTAITNLTVTATSGASPYTWTAVGLPAGLAISAGGVISGTPTTAGTSTVALTARDTTGRTGSKTFTWNVAAPLVFTAPAAQQGTVGQATSLTLSASEGTSPYTWTITGLPAGLTATAAGVISGTPTAAATSTVSATVTDAVGRKMTRGFSWVVAVGPAVNAPVTQNSTTGTAITNLTVTATSGAGPYTWTATGLPAGLTISSGGVISGTPSTVGATTVTLTATDSTGRTGSKTLTWNVAAPLVFTAPAAQQSTVGQATSLTLSASEGTGPYTWTVTGLPAGLTATAAGVISGTPTSAATSTVSATVTDAVGRSLTHDFTWTVAAPLTVTNPGGQVGTVGVASTLTLAAHGGTSPYTWTATGVPAGLSLSTTGVLTGTPTLAGDATVTATATDAAGRTSDISFPMDVKGPVVVTDPGTQNSMIETAATLTLTANGGTGPYTWTTLGLPDGMTLDAAEGVISGTATAAGTDTVSVTVTDSAGRTATTTFTWTVAVPLTITNPGAQTSTVDTAATVTLAATGGDSPYTWVADALPAGLTIDTATGAISGTPAEAGTASVTVTVTDTANRSATSTFAWTVDTPLAIAAITGQNGTVGTSTTLTPTANGGTTPYTWSALGLPDGLALNTTTGTITGTPTTVATWAITLKATDANGRATSTTFLWDVRTAPAIAGLTAQTGDQSSADPATGTWNGPAAVNTAPPTVSGGKAPYTWSATGLPDGLAITAGTGIVSGTATAAGAFRPVITVTDAAGRTTTATIEWKIYAATTAGPVMDAGKAKRIGSFPGDGIDGVAVLGGYAFTTQDNQIMKVDTHTGETTVRAGTTSRACIDGDTGDTARFNGPKVIGSDGALIYVADCGLIRTVDPVTGATRMLVYTGDASRHAIAGHRLFYITGDTLYQYDLQTRATTTLAPLGGTAIYRALAADDTSVWVTVNQTLLRYDFTGQQIASLTLPYNIGGQMLAVGDYLYATDYGKMKIARISKTDGTTRMIAGDSAADGLLLFQVSGIGTDGTTLYIADDHGLTAVTATTRTWATPPTAPTIRFGTVTTVTHYNDQPEGLAVLGDSLFTGVGNQIVKTNKGTQETTPVAGTTTRACIEGDNGDSARFIAPKVIGSDGALIYVADCGLVRTVNPANGATRMLVYTGDASRHAIAGHRLFYIAGDQLHQYNLQTGAPTTMATLPSAAHRALAADDSSAWVINGDTLLRFTFDGQATTLATHLPFPMEGVMASIGEYLYYPAPRPNLPDPLPYGTPQPPELAAISKDDGTKTSVWTETPDGIHTDPWNGTGRGLAYDGTDLYTIDTSANLRRIGPTPWFSLDPPNDLPPVDEAMNYQVIPYLIADPELVKQPNVIAAELAQYGNLDRLGVKPATGGKPSEIIRNETISVLSAATDEPASYVVDSSRFPGSSKPDDPYQSATLDECSAHTDKAATDAGWIKNRYSYCQQHLVGGVALRCVFRVVCTLSGVFLSTNTVIGNGKIGGYQATNHVRWAEFTAHVKVHTKLGVFGDTTALMAAEIKCDGGYDDRNLEHQEKACTAGNNDEVIKSIPAWDIAPDATLDLTSEAEDPAAEWGEQIARGVFRIDYNFDLPAAYNDFIVSSQEGGMRFDSAWYIHPPNKAEQVGSIFDRAIPGFSYSLGDKAVKGVYEHLQRAQQKPQFTWPWRSDKVLAGATPRNPLHRLAQGRGLEEQIRAKKNETVRTSYCNSFEFQRQKKDNGRSYDCDEYPFASTYEGAGRSDDLYDGPDYDRFYSVEWVCSEQNQEAGRRLLGFYRNDRILNGDEFFVPLT